MLARWRTSYDILVYPANATIETAKYEVVEPNAIMGIPGGISLQQYDLISSIADVEVAAPLAVLGHARTLLVLKIPPPSERKVYRLTTKMSAFDGVTTHLDSVSYYRLVSKGPAVEKYKTKHRIPKMPYNPQPQLPPEFGMQIWQNSYLPMKDLQTSVSLPITIVGIDPAKESALVGLDEAIAEGRFLAEDDKPDLKSIGGHFDVWHLPSIALSSDLLNATLAIEVEMLDLEYSDELQMLEDIKNRGGEAYLGTVDGTTVYSKTFPKEEVNRLVALVLSSDPNSPEATSGLQAWVRQPATVSYEPDRSPYPDRWPLAMKAEAVGIEEFAVKGFSPGTRSIDYRPKVLPPEPDKRFLIRVIGKFDPGRLRLALDPLTELPMETYAPSEAKLVLDKDGQPRNPVPVIRPVPTPGSFLAPPPVILTTIDSVAKLKGDRPISAIRVRVRGLGTSGEKDHSRVKTIAREIENKTGLRTLVTFGSSPRRVLVQLEGYGDMPSPGYVEQPWIQIGAVATILRESKIGYSGVVTSIILVAVIYVLASNTVSILSRRRELGILTSIGWDGSARIRLVMTEALVIGVGTALMSLVMTWFLVGWTGVSRPLARVLLAGLSPIGVYSLGAIIPARFASRMDPVAAFRQGDVTGSRFGRLRVRSLMGMAGVNVLRRLHRNLLSVSSMAFPSALANLFFFVSLRLRGVLYLSYAGEYVALEITPLHYAAISVALAVSAVTVAQITWLNLAERQRELALLKAIGWDSGKVAKTVIFEGIVVGFFGGLAGSVFGLVGIALLYRAVPETALVATVVSISVATITGAAGSVIPTVWALKAAQGQESRDT